MAEQERLTKAERREQKRQKRQAEEQQAKEQAARERRRNATYAIALVGVVGVLVFLAVDNSAPSLENAITLTQGQAEDARLAAGCEVLDQPEITDADMVALGIPAARSHLEPATAPAAETLYVNGRPTNSGPHYTNPLPVRNGVPDNALDERGSTHNLEHGSVLVWIDGEQVSGDDVNDIDAWVETLNTSGFAENTGRAGILASPIFEEGIDSGKALAVRAWGVSMDCDSWDRDWANAFVLDHFGPRGTAPEQFTAFPEDALAYVDGDNGDGDDATDEPSDDATDDVGDEPTDTATDEPTDAES